MNFLIIDDDEYKVENFTQYLSTADSYIVKKSYNSGLRELFLNKEVNYDCLILDMNFPVFDDEQVEENRGLRVLRELQKRGKDIPVIIYSSKFVNTAQYKNVKDYILYEGYDLTNRIKSIKNKLNE